MEKVLVPLIFLFFVSSSFAEKNDTRTDKNIDQSKKTDKRDKRQTLNEMLTLYGGWKPILPGNPYYFGSEKRGGTAKEHDELKAASYIQEPISIFIQDPTVHQHKKDIYSYYPPPVINSNYQRGSYPKPLYTERNRRRNHGNQGFQNHLLLLKGEPKHVELVNLDVEVITTGSDRSKQIIEQTSPKLHEVQLTSFPVLPHVLQTNPVNRPPPQPLINHPQPQLTFHKPSDVVLPAISVHPTQIQPIKTAPQKEPLKQAELVLTAEPLYSQVQHQPAPSLLHLPNNGKQEVLVTAISGDLDLKDSGDIKEEIKVVPVDLAHDALKPAAVVDEVIEVKNIPVGVVEAPGDGTKQYASSNGEPYVEYVPFSEEEFDQLFKAPSEQDRQTYSGSQKQPVRSHVNFQPYMIRNEKTEQVVNLNIKPGQSVEEAIIELAKENRNSDKIAENSPFETIEVVAIPSDDYRFSERSEKAINHDLLAVADEVKIKNTTQPTVHAMK